MPRPLSLAASAFSPDPRVALSIARDLKFRAVQLHLPSSSPLTQLDRTGQRDFLKLLSSLDLTLTSLSTTAGRLGFAPRADIDRALDHLDKALRTAADLGRVCLCIDLGPLPPPPPPPAEDSPKPATDTLLTGGLILPTAADVASVSTPAPQTPAAPRDEAFESTLDAALLELGRRADRYGVPVALRSELAPLASLHRALAAARCPLFALDLDPVALLKDPWPVERVLADFAPLGGVAHLRCRDARKGAPAHTQPAPVGQGSTDFPALLALVDAAAFRGPLTLDPSDLQDRHAATLQARTHLAPHLPPT